MEKISDVIEAYATVVIGGGSVLLVHYLEGHSQRSGQYGLPGGKREKNESPIETAQRELKEETGLEVHQDELILIPKQYVAQLEMKSGEKRTFSMEVFGVTQWMGTLQSSRETRPEWIPLTELDTLLLSGNTKEAIVDTLNHFERML